MLRFQIAAHQHAAAADAGDRPGADYWFQRFTSAAAPQVGVLVSSGQPVVRVR